MLPESLAPACASSFACTGMVAEGPKPRAAAALRFRRQTEQYPRAGHSRRALLQIVGGDKLIIPFADGAAHEPIQRPAFSA